MGVKYGRSRGIGSTDYLYETGQGLALRPKRRELRAGFDGSYRAEVLRDDPLVLWMLGDASGIVAEDESRNGRDASYEGGVTLAQPSIIPTTVATSVSFDGTDDYVAVLTASWMDVGSITVEVILNTPASGTRAIFSRDDNSNRDWYMVMVGTDLYWGVRNTSNALVELGPTTIAANTSTHVAATFDAASTAKVYVNGVEVLSGAVAGSLRQAGAAIRLGRYLVNSGNYGGKLQGAAIHNTALPAARILAHAVAAGLA